MQKLITTLCLTTLAAITVAAFAQQTREQAVNGMRKVEAKEMDPTLTTPASFAKKLIDEALAKHPEILLIAIHAAPRDIRMSSLPQTLGVSAR